ncbi:hypothetical protein [Paenibacillus castaneae]|uniref:hypothetical protein n=1 Tax=Paenibacillus castaneae TaxID=474957 RepID=UPI001ABBB0CE|nr:hypothetical protein [Paenibacillus castaneae]
MGIAWIPLSEITDYKLHPNNDVNFILGAPTRNVLSEWIANQYEDTYIYTRIG